MYPNKTQREAIRKNIDACRFVYNWALETKKAAYEWDGTNLSWYDLNKQLTRLKDIHLWLKETNSQSLQHSVKRLYMAFQSFLHRFKQGEEKLGYPKFRSKKRHRQSFDVPQYFTIDFTTRRVRLPKIGKIRTAIHRRIIGKLKTCTVVTTNTGKVFISIVVEDGQSTPKKSPVTKKNSLGIDLGITTYATTSSGVKIGNPRHLQNALKRLRCLHRRLSKKKPGSKNREKARLRLASCYERITNQRRDFQQKLSTNLIRENQAIIVESLHIRGIIRNRRLAKAVSDAAWSHLLGMLKYKAEWYGVTLIEIGSFNPTTKRCHLCGYINDELTLSDREWVCPDCGTEHDRDVNAAQNIKIIGLQSIKTPGEPREEPVDQSALADGMKQETSSLVTE